VESSRDSSCALLTKDAVTLLLFCPSCPTGAPLECAGPLAGGQWQAAEGDAGLRAQLSELVDRFQQLTQVPAALLPALWLYSVQGQLDSWGQRQWLRVWLNAAIKPLPACPALLFPPPLCGLQNARDTASSLFGGSIMLGGPLLPAGAAAAAGLASGSTALAGPAAAVAGGGTEGAAEDRRRSSLEASTSLGVFELIEGSPEGAAASPLWTRARPPPLGLAELSTFFDAEGEAAHGWLSVGCLASCPVNAPQLCH
jgi:hypothetical protein